MTRTYRDNESVSMGYPGAMRKRRGRVADRTGPQLRTPQPQSTDILSWAEVNLTHRIQNGVYQRNGRLISLLTDFGRINPCYPDRMSDEPDTLLYTGNGRRGDQYLNPGNRALLAATESRHRVPLFNKLAVGQWQHMGFWRVISGRQIFDQQEQRMLWQFTLKRDPTSE